MRMIKWIVIYFIFFPLISFTQVDIFNTSLTDSQLTILYVGVLNNIVVSGLDKDTTLKLTLSTGEVFQSKWNKDPNKFIVKTRYTNIKTDTLKLYQAEKLLLTKIFEIKTIGYPILKFGDLSDSFATIQEILSNPTLHVFIPDCYYNIDFRVKCFEVSFLSATGDTIKSSESINSYYLTKNHIDIIRTLKSGDKILFTSIIAICNGCINKRFKQLIITIK